MIDYPEKTADPLVREETLRTAPAPRESSGAVWYILGGVIVALIVLFALFSGGAEAPAPQAETAPATQAAPTEATPAPSTEAAPAPANN